jgi:hypothetical protein
MADSTPVAVSGTSRTLLHSGATLAMRDGRLVPAHYGSVAGEIAVSVRAVGIADRVDLDAMEISGDPELLEATMPAVGAQLPPVGAAAPARGVWLCRLADGRVQLIGFERRLEAWRRALAARHAKLAVVTGRDANLTAITVVGPRAHAVLGDVGVQQPGLPGTVQESPLVDQPVTVLCENPEWFLLLVDGKVAPGVWTMLVDAARARGGSHVGHDALQRLRATQGHHDLS